MDLHSESECSDDEPDDMRDEREGDEDEGKGESDDDELITSKTFFGATRRERRALCPPDPSNTKLSIIPQTEDDGSVTGMLFSNLYNSSVH